MDYARKHSRYGHSESTMILVAYRHFFSPPFFLSLPSPETARIRHPIRGDEISCLRKLRRDSRTRLLLSSPPFFSPTSSSSG